jgi:predicted DNA-binding protein (UPF0251 family)/DNA-binding XRE family transcriptional regulator
MFATINSVTIKRRRLEMKKTVCDEDIFYGYPSKEEIKAAQLACCGRCCDACETPAEYAWRKRGVDLAMLLEHAIENELSEAEKSAVRNRWFESMTVSEIAAMQGISTAAVSVTLKRAQDKLFRALNYAVKYQQGIADETALPLIMGRARVIASARNSVGITVSQRVRNLRLSQNLSRKALEKGSGIALGRIFAIESGKADPDMRELVVLCDFFGVTADYIVKGEKYDRE